MTVVVIRCPHCQNKLIWLGVPRPCDWCERPVETVEKGS